MQEHQGKAMLEVTLLVVVDSRDTMVLEVVVKAQ
jgi:hypothetical protein